MITPLRTLILFTFYDTGLHEHMRLHTLRSMQLAETLFTVVVVQIKPQLEKVLGLRPHSLAKEVALTQTLTNLFTKVCQNSRYSHGWVVEVWSISRSG